MRIRRDWRHDSWAPETFPFLAVSFLIAAAGDLFVGSAHVRTF
jgi:hypothetical protein